MKSSSGRKREVDECKNKQLSELTDNDNNKLSITRK